MAKFHLISHQPSGGPRTESGPSRYEYLEVEPGPQQLVVIPGKGPRLVLDAGENRENCLTIEPIFRDQQHYLALRVPEGANANLNGTRMGSAAVARELDCIQIDGHPGLHVVLHHSPEIGPPSKDELGKNCPVCLTPFVEDTIRYRCWNCGTALHHEGEEKPAEERLECVQLAPNCPACSAPVLLTQGYKALPELGRE